MRAGRIGRQSGFGGARWRLRLFVLGSLALALYLVITAPAQSAHAVAHVAHQLSVFVRSFK
jgi:multisubunit Na+/H+ antiporter MnhG subunit